MGQKGNGQRGLGRGDWAESVYSKTKKKANICTKMFSSFLSLVDVMVSFAISIYLVGLSLGFYPVGIASGYGRRQETLEIEALGWALGRICVLGGGVVLRGA